MSFDFDGTLAHPKIATEKIYFNALKDYISYPLIEQKFKLFESDHLQIHPDLKDKIRSFGKLNVPEREKLFYQWNGERLKYILPDLSDSEFTQLLDSILSNMKENSEMELYPEIKNVLHYLYENNFLLFILSGNNKKYIQDFLINNGLESIFNQIFTPDSLNMNKKEIFDYYKSNYKTDEMVHIGDDPELDYHIPKSLGIHAVWLKRENGRYIDSSIPDDEKITTLNEIMPMIKSLKK